MAEILTSGFWEQYGSLLLEGTRDTLIMTVISTVSRLTSPCPIRSRRRPGQAISTSTPRARALACGFCPTPPNTTVEVSRAGPSSVASDSWIWEASSRVGASTRARGRFGWRREALWPSRVMSGRRKA